MCHDRVAHVNVTSEPLPPPPPGSDSRFVTLCFFALRTHGRAQWAAHGSCSATQAATTALVVATLAAVDRWALATVLHHSSGKVHAAGTEDLRESGRHLCLRLPGGSGVTAPCGTAQGKLLSWWCRRCVAPTALTAPVSHLLTENLKLQMEEEKERRQESTRHACKNSIVEFSLTCRSLTPNLEHGGSGPATSPCRRGARRRPAPGCLRQGYWFLLRVIVMLVPRLQVLQAFAAALEAPVFACVFAENWCQESGSLRILPGVLCHPVVGIPVGADFVYVPLVSDSHLSVSAFPEELTNF